MRNARKSRIFACHFRPYPSCFAYFRGLGRPGGKNRPPPRGGTGLSLFDEKTREKTRENHGFWHAFWAKQGSNVVRGGTRSRADFSSQKCIKIRYAANPDGPVQKTVCFFPQNFAKIMFFSARTTPSSPGTSACSLPSFFVLLRPSSSFFVLFVPRAATGPLLEGPAAGR